MSKQKKKRNKAYSVPAKTVIRIQASNKSALSRWWSTSKNKIKPIAIAIIVVALILWFIIEIFTSFFHS